jgi:hypothetical protein
MLKKVLLFVMVLFAGAGLGLFAGWKLSSSSELLREWRSFDNPEGHDFFKAYDLMARLEMADMGSATRLQNPVDGPDRRREYLNLILEAAKTGRAQVTDPAALTLVDVEMGITYVRLAMVEQAAGNLAASQTLIQRAQAILKEAGWKDYSEVHLKELVQALNKQDSLCDSPCGGH